MHVKQEATERKEGINMKQDIGCGTAFGNRLKNKEDG